MRMWNVDPKLLCRKHLLGEHVEMHMFAGCLNKDKNINGYIEKGLVELEYIFYRHSHLAAEMFNRGFKHKSPLALLKFRTGGKVNVSENIEELKRRCTECRKRIENQ